ncbi:hypothetical protein NIES4072_72450 [Nostoc commune NIES-4072]|uniref:Uncharacterized protein n=1 Tax=Nostoc commune NIES-4072 TaxID=2005467 RepID=A0A2R5G4Z6_NOSCO|nr:MULTISPECIES: hypothetical protein [Nostoc]MDZ8126711.1 hypothetical protein [Nostoc sp. CmiVER01]BBD70022.1 hypothetical protein NIES4070_64330 [Nostoc commune HK-02]GBG23533.1 hypothetical protein NIES4072_72450 [Nostoc commune NIES-4072]
MNQAWREQLFSQKTTNSGLNPLVLPITNAKMLRVLDICYRTWERWAEVAETIPQYKLSRIQMQKMAKEKKLRAPLIRPYQVWVLGKIGEVFGDLDQGTTKIEIAKSIVEANKSEYTIKEFETEQIRFTQSLTGELQNV